MLLVALFRAFPCWRRRGAGPGLLAGLPGGGPPVPAAIVAGAPIFAALGGAALIFFWTGGETVAAIPLNHYRLTVNPTLPSIPLFTLAGYFLAEGGAARRFVQVFDAWFGHVRGGPAIITVLVCAFFTSFTGASGVTILALGGLPMPVLPGCGVLGAVVARPAHRSRFPRPAVSRPACRRSVRHRGQHERRRQHTHRRSFRRDWCPDSLMAMAIWWGVRCGPKATGPARHFDRHAAWDALRGAFWDLLIPAVALFFLFSGLATPCLKPPR